MRGTLKDQVRQLIGDTPVMKAAELAGVGTGTLQYLLSGKTTEPKPSTLQLLAETFGGESVVDRQRAYTELMFSAGYLDFLLPEMLEVLQDLDFPSSAESTTS